MAEGSGSDVAVGSTTRPPRQPLDQMRILHEAVRFIDERGLPMLTMRRLGAQLGVEAMALYRYVPGREQLLDGVVEVVMDELYRETQEGPLAQNWQEYLQKSAHSVRRLALNHPRIFPLVATRPPAAPRLRPPLRSLRWVESFLDRLRDFGFGPEHSVKVYRAFATFLLGQLLLESSTMTPLEAELPVSEDIAFIESNDLNAYPLVTSYAPMLSLDAYGDEFEEALEDLINRVAPMLEPNPRLVSVVAARPKRIPRACSDVFRFWAALGLSILLGVVAQIVIGALQAAGVLEEPTGRRSDVELEFGAELIAWNAFALSYLLLGIRAFAGCDRAELVRRIQGSPLPRSGLARYLLAGGGGPTWAVVISLVAFGTIVAAAQTRADSTRLVLALIAITMLTCWMTITFSFALHYARRDIEVGGLEFSGTDEPVFSDYNYLAIGCSATFGTTDTAIVTSSMRRTVSVHSVIAFFFNTLVIAVLLSVIVG